VVSLVIPTYNEAGSIGSLLKRVLELPLDDIVVVDDASPDMTATYARHFEPSVKVVVRHHIRGLASAVRAGVQETTSEFVMVMDGDGQHLPEDARGLLELHSSNVGNHDVIIGSRFATGSRLSGLALWRKLASRLLNGVCNITTRTWCSDPLTGFCIVRRELLLATQTPGFKFLFEILLNCEVKVLEYPITFAPRSSGNSKASVGEIAKLLRTPHWESASVGG